VLVERVSIDYPQGSRTALSSVMDPEARETHGCIAGSLHQQSVGTEGMQAGLTSMSFDCLESAVANKMWFPQYVPLKLAS
jgi:hypothetical protein